MWHLAFLRLEYAGHHFGNGPGDLDNGPGDADNGPGDADNGPSHVSDGSDDGSDGSEDFASRFPGAPEELADAESNGNDSDVAHHLTQRAVPGTCTACRLFPDVPSGDRALGGIAICESRGAEASTRKQGVSS